MVENTANAMDQRSRYRQFEEQFHQQLRARAGALMGRSLPADRLQVEALGDGVDSVRDTLTRLRKTDRGLLESLPGTRANQLRFQRRVFGPFYKTVARLRAMVLVPIEALVNDQAPGPVGREQVLDALARYELLPQDQRPTDVVFASPTGFTAEARAMVHAGGRPSIVLLGGREDGGWDLEMPERVGRSPWSALFHLESQDERLKRLLYHLNRNVSLLDSRGIALDELAREMGLPPEQVEGLIRQACRNDARLMTVVQDGRTHVCRSPFAEVSESMSLQSSLRTWLRKLFRLKPTAAEQVRQWTAQRVQLEQQRHEIDQRIEAFEREEREIFERNASAKNDVERKQLVDKLKRTRRELQRAKIHADFLTRQIDVIGGHIHHLTLEEQGRRVSLPDTEELARKAAEVEHMRAEVKASADLMTSIEASAVEAGADAEDDALFAELERAAARGADREPGEAAGPAAASAEGAPVRLPSEPADEKRQSARPEVG